MHYEYSIACLEDKIVQQAVVSVLSTIYEGDFLGFSYGFRPGRGPHDALDALAVGLVKQKVWWVLDADIQQFYDTLDRHWLRRFLRHRVGDKRLLRLINKWLEIDIINADGQKMKPEKGIAQGLVIGPLMSTSTCIMSSTSGVKPGVRRGHQAMSSSRALPMISCWGFNTSKRRRTLETSWPSGSAPLASPCTRARPAGLSSVALRPSAGSSGDWAS